MKEQIENIEKLLAQLVDKLNIRDKEILDINEVVTLTSLSKKYIYKLSHLGKIPCYSYSNNSKLYFKKTELENWMTKSKRFYEGDVDDFISRIEKNGVPF